MNQLTQDALTVPMLIDFHRRKLESAIASMWEDRLCRSYRETIEPVLTNLLKTGDLSDAIDDLGEAFDAWDDEEDMLSALRRAKGWLSEINVRLEALHHAETHAMNTLGERLKARRQMLRLTQEDLAKKAEISKGFLSEVENNSRNLSADNLMKLARELGVSLDYLMKGEGNTDSPLREKLQIPASLAKFAVEENLQFDETITLLGMKKQVVARRRDEGDDDLESFDWKKFYESVKDYL